VAVDPPLLKSPKPSLPGQESWEDGLGSERSRRQQSKNQGKVEKKGGEQLYKYIFLELHVYINIYVCKEIYSIYIYM